MRLRQGTEWLDAILQGLTPEVYYGLDDLEDYYLATEVLERVREGQEKVHSAAEVRKGLSLED